MTADEKHNKIRSRNDCDDDEHEEGRARNAEMACNESPSKWRQKSCDQHDHNICHEIRLALAIHADDSNQKEVLRCGAGNAASEGGEAAVLRYGCASACNASPR